MWKDTIMTLSRFCPSISLEVLIKTMESSVNDGQRSAKIQIQTYPEHKSTDYCYINQSGHT
jgi:hypothetical protein